MVVLLVAPAVLQSCVPVLAPTGGPTSRALCWAAADPIPCSFLWRCCGPVPSPLLVQEALLRVPQKWQAFQMEVEAEQVRRDRESVSTSARRTQRLQDTPFSFVDSVEGLEAAAKALEGVQEVAVHMPTVLLYCCTLAFQCNSHLQILGAVCKRPRRGRTLMPVTLSLVPKTSSLVLFWGWDPW